MGKLIVEHQQSIYDIAIQLYGSVEGVFNLMAANTGTITNLNYQPQAGSPLNTTGAATNPVALKVIQRSNIKPATALSQTLTPLLNVDNEPILNIMDDMLYNIQIIN